MALSQDIYTEKINDLRNQQKKVASDWYSKYGSSTANTMVESVLQEGSSPRMKRDTLSPDSIHYQLLALDDEIKKLESRENIYEKGSATRPGARSQTSGASALVGGSREQSIFSALV